MHVVTPLILVSALMAMPASVTPAAAHSGGVGAGLRPWCAPSAETMTVRVVAPAGATTSDATDLDDLGITVGTSDRGAFTSLWGSAGAVLATPSVGGRATTAVSGPRVNNLGEIVAAVEAAGSAGQSQGSLARWAWFGAKPTTGGPSWDTPPSGRRATYHVKGVSRSAVALVQREYAGLLMETTLVARGGEATTVPVPYQMYTAVGLADDGTVLGMGALRRGVPNDMSSGVSLTKNGESTILPKLDPASTGYGSEMAGGISRDGRFVVGRSSGRPVWWDAARAVHDMAGAPANFTPTAVNACGAAVGVLAEADGRRVAAEWRDGVFGPLATRTVGLPSDKTICAASAVNALGFVSGALCSAGTVGRVAVVLSPVG